MRNRRLSLRTFLGAVVDRVLRGRVLVAVAVSLLALVGLAGCSSDDQPEPEADSAGQTATAAEAAERRGEAKPTVTIGITDWTGARINVAIAELIIERRLGYPVEPSVVIDNRIMVDDLAAADLDAVLEVWPSGLTDEDRDRVDRGEVANLGTLGVVGKNGWFVPRYLVEEDPTLASWEALADPATAGRFATAATGRQGRFLGTDPQWDQHDEDLIEALGLPLEVEYSGSEEATTAELARLTGRREPILLYWFTPSAQIAEYDLVPVMLPTRTDDCVAEAAAGGLEACDYGEEQLLKLGAVDLAERAPDLHRFLTRFTIETEEQVGLIDQVDNAGRTVTDVAAAWVDDNQERWERWLES